MASHLHFVRTSQRFLDWPASWLQTIGQLWFMDLNRRPQINKIEA